MTYRVCVFEGDDAAPEAVRPTVDLLESLDTDVEFYTPTVEEHVDDLLNGIVPDPIVDAIEESDTVLFGACNQVHNPILWYLRRDYGSGTYVNLRPIRHIPGAQSALAAPNGVDYLIIRENLEGIYFGAEDDLTGLADITQNITDADGRHVAKYGDGAYALRVISEVNTRRFARRACELAKDWFHGDINYTCATKANVLARTDGLFRDLVEDVAANYDTLHYEHLHTDDVGQRLVAAPEQFDVVVTPNYAGDLLSDVGAGTTGGLGVAPSGCYGDERAYFEPVHGTAPDIAGEGIINPTATILSAGMLLDYLGLGGEADRLRDSVEAVYAAGDTLTPDQGGSASTEEFAAAVAAKL